MYFVYIIQSLIDNNLYIGITNDLKQRLKRHNSGQVNSTKHRAPFKFIYSESLPNSIEARKREKYFKSGIGREFIKKTLLNQQPIREKIN
ncbi:MAG: GIY-YIG nuclease family protein [Candidatus Margulisiibacteriota bacterium]